MKMASQPQQNWRSWAFVAECFELFLSRTFGLSNAPKVDLGAMFFSES